MNLRFWEPSRLDGTPFECDCRSVRFVVIGSVVNAGAMRGKPAILPVGSVLACLDCDGKYELTAQGLRNLLKRRVARAEAEEDPPTPEDLPDTDFNEPTRERQARLRAIRGMK